MKLNPLDWFAPTRDQAEEWSLGDDAVLQAFYGALSAVSASGVRVTQESALRSVAVLACLIVRAETFSALPVDVLRKEGARGRARRGATPPTGCSRSPPTS